MIVELTREQRDQLLELVNLELLEIGPEIRHTTRRNFRDDLKEQRRVLTSLRDLLSDIPDAVPPDLPFHHVPGPHLPLA
jgi:hypothetical protein